MEFDQVQAPAVQPVKPPARFRRPHLRLALKNYWQRLNRRQKLVLKSIALFLVFIVVVQLAYPRNRFLPNTQILGKSYGFKTKSVAVTHVAEVTNAKITIEVSKDKIDTTLQNMGLEIDGLATVRPALKYSWLARLVPFSLFTRHKVNDFGVVSKDTAKTRQFLASLEKYNTPPKDASVKVSGTDITVVPAQNGYSYTNDSVQSSLSTIRISSDYSLKLTGSVQRPSLFDSVAQKTVVEAKARLDHKLAVSIDNQVVTVSKDDLASWMTFAPDATKKTINLSYDQAKIKAYLDPYAKKVYVAQVPRQVSTLDGEITGQVPGKAGRAMQLDKSAVAVASAAAADKELAITVILPVDPATKESATYTRSSKGVQALINSWVKAHSGSYYVAMRELSGGINAAYSASTGVTPASIYKLYVADVIYTKAANGEIDLTSQAMAGKSINDCIELMIVRSDNTCAHALGDMIGWQKNNGFLASQGFGSTSLGPLSTTASNTLNYLIKLQNGSLINSTYSDTLLGYMRRQIYRGGIPAGSNGAVADKVGFIDNLNHDAGIVYHPNGTYALVIMSKNSSFTNIADLSRQISNVMSQ